MTHKRSLLLLLAVLIGTATDGLAKPTLDVEVGWGGCYRVGRWTPIYVTLSDSKTQNVLLRLSIPHDNTSAMVIQQTVAINPTPATYALYAPLGGSTDEMSVEVLDPASRMRRLADWKFDPYDTSPRQFNISAVGQLIVISGQANPRIIEGHFDARNTSVRACDPLRLPAVANGYEGLNALLLNQPDIARLTVEQQQAMVDWTLGGGCIVFWASADQQPPAGPLVDALPAVIGDNIVLDVPVSKLDEAGLPHRYAQLKARALQPRSELSEPVTLLGGTAMGYRKRVGLGSVTVLPIDPSQFVFMNQDRARDFWLPLLKSAVDLTPPPTDSTNPNYYPSYNDPLAQRRALGTGQVMDRIADIPGAGRFGFTYVVVIMLGLMLVVGPVDWFVLKWLGRQPWTWLTTTGWIGVVSLAALYIGHAIRSGELHLNTVRIIDQAGAITVGTTDAVAVYAPKTEEYSIRVEPDGFWQPLTAETYYYRRGIKRQIPFHQDYHGSRPLPDRINVWSLRLLSGDTIAPGLPAVRGSAKIDTRGGKSYLVGSLSNLGDLPLERLIAAAPGGTCTISAAPLEPGGSVEFSVPVQPPVKPEQPEYVYGPYGGYPKPISGLPMEYDLAAGRSLAIERAISDGGFFCIYALAESKSTAVELTPKPDRARHQVLIRALLPLEKAKP